MLKRGSRDFKQRLRTMTAARWFTGNPHAAGRLGEEFWRRISAFGRAFHHLFDG